MLERELADFAAHVAYPKPRPAWRAVATRLDRRRPRPWIIAAAAAGAVLALGAAVPAARSTVLGWFGVRGVSIVRIDRLPELPTPSRRELGVPTTLERARKLVPFQVRLVHGERPARVYAGLDNPPAITLVYGSPERPRLLLTEYRVPPGETAVDKEVPPGVEVEAVVVDGAKGLWVRGGHVVHTAGATRIAANTLVWERGGVLYRLEADVPKSEALELSRPLTRSSAR